jgi:hypothetical protein
MTLTRADTCSGNTEQEAAVASDSSERKKKKQEMKGCYVAEGKRRVRKSRVRNSWAFSAGFAMMAEAQRTSPSQLTFTSN